jgi:hypothetical protein
MEEDNWYRRNARNRLLIIGIMLTGFGFYQLPTVLTGKSSLSPLKGTIRAVDTYVTTVSDGEGHKSQKSELVFYLNEFRQKYYLSENIGDSYTNDKYETIRQGLRQTDSVTVWVKKNEISVYEPEVFQIESDNKIILLEYESVISSQVPITIFLFFMGLGSIGVYLYSRFPDRVKKIFT